MRGPMGCARTAARNSPQTGTVLTDQHGLPAAQRNSIRCAPSALNATCVWSGRHGADRRIPAATLQQLAFRRILLRIWEAGSATLHAAPGAGKTLFAATLFRHLYDRGIVRRIVIFVPNSNLVEQTVKAYGKLGIHLDGKPRDSTIEHPETVGLVVCYQSLSSGSVESISPGCSRPRPSSFSMRCTTWPTRTTASGAITQRMVGKVSDGPPLHAMAVLNMTGTLFRSTSTQRISTVRYRRIGEDTHEAIADHSVTTAELVGTGCAPRTCMFTAAGPSSST